MKKGTAKPEERSSLEVRDARKGNVGAGGDREDNFAADVGDEARPMPRKNRVFRGSARRTPHAR